MNPIENLVTGASEHSRMFQTIIDAIPIRIYWKGGDLRYLGCNRLFAMDAGYADPTNLIGKRDADLPWNGCAEQYDAEDHALIGSNTDSPSRETKLMTATGQEIPVRLSKYVLHDASRTPIGILGCYEDLTDRKHSELNLNLSGVAIEKSRNAFFWVSSRGQVVYANDFACNSLGYTRQELIGKFVWDFDPDYAPEDQEKFWALIRENHIAMLESRHRRKDGSIFPIQVTANYIASDNQELVFCTVYDISDRKRDEENLKLTQFAIDHASVEVYQVDTDARIVYANQQACQALGYSKSELIGKYIPDIDPIFDRSKWHAHWEELRQKKSLSFETRHLKKDGSIYTAGVSANYIHYGDKEFNFAFAQDITERRASQQKIHKLAYYDDLTGLPNRRLIIERLSHTLAMSARTDQFGALLYLDMDNFKHLNDSKGHLYGDMLLVEVTKRLMACVRETDTVARIGGDEFVVMIENIATNIELAISKTSLLAQKILTAIGHPYFLKGHEHHSSSSIGITFFHGNENTIDELFSQSDMAMYEAKKSGRNTFRLFDPVMQAELDKRMELERLLRGAIYQEQFRLYYQIQVNNLGETIGLEALIRWQHPELGMISPAEFIPIAEETGMIITIGRWVLETACAQLKTFESNLTLSSLPIAVNISAIHFQQQNFVDEIKAIADSFHINPNNLKIELTENIVLNDIEEAIVKMKELSNHGFQLSLDDFGTGYSSLSYLRRLPFNQLKIDRSFVINAIENPNDAFIVEMVISLGEKLGMDVIAEGVETEDQLKSLKVLGCNEFQGYFFGKPQPIEELAFV